MNERERVHGSRSEANTSHRSSPGGDRVWHTLAVSEVAKLLDSDLDGGLAETQVRQRLEEFGLNQLDVSEGRSALVILWTQFQSLMVALLGVATLIAVAMGETVQAIAILVVIVLNASIGFFTEWKAERTLAALQKQAVTFAQVVRDGTERQIPAVELVPGDLVILAAGGRVPADGRVVEAVRLQIDEAALTGESHAVAKVPEPVADAEVPLGDRTDMAFMGTTITDGRGQMLVTSTGMRTEVGQIGTLIDEAGTQGTPLEKRLDQLGRALIGIVLALCAIIVFLGWLRGNPFLHMIEVGISLAIAAVPEGLPAVATMTLAIGMQRMARMRALIRRLPAVESLGSVTVICTDKTGTLTKNEMTVNTLVLGDRRIEVTGAGYQAVGEFLTAEGERIEPESDAQLELALRIGLLCNDSQIERTAEGDTVLGDPTEGALVVAAEKAGIKSDTVERAFPRIDEVPFDSDTKRMVTVHRAAEAGGVVAFVKGSPGALLDMSQAQLRNGGAVESLTTEARERYLEANGELAGAALRVLGLAYRELPDNYSPEDLDRDLIFVGLVGMLDPLREEVRPAIATCREAGIRTVMITGDQPSTAAEIGRQLGLDRDAAGHPLATVHARELDKHDPERLGQIAATASVFARVSPKHKLQLVEALQQRGEVVAMTGDGVNDAPALKQADIGVAMGIKGTEVAKESASMVITDDNFATIVSAVEQGRIIYANILKFIRYLFSCNFAEILTVFVSIMVGWPLPLGPLQILWLNMVTDVFPAFALALEPSAPNMMKRAPRDPHEGLINRPFLVLIGWQGALLATVTLIPFALGLRWHGTEPDGVRRAATMAFMTLALAQAAHAFNARSHRGSIFTAQLFTNLWLWAAVLVCGLLQVAAVSVPLLRRVLHTVPPTGREWALIIICSLTPIVVVELVKLVIRSVSTAADVHDMDSTPRPAARGTSPS